MGQGKRENEFDTSFKGEGKNGELEREEKAGKFPKKKEGRETTTTTYYGEIGRGKEGRTSI